MTGWISPGHMTHWDSAWIRSPEASMWSNHQQSQTRTGLGLGWVRVLPAAFVFRANSATYWIKRTTEIQLATCTINNRSQSRENSNPFPADMS